MAANFPNSPNTNDTFTSNGVTFTWDGEAWKQPASPGVKGSKGQKGEVGQKGQKGDGGDKGQKGEIGLSGNPGGDGTDGDKGQKGDTGADGNDGSDGTSVKGDKGQKGVDGDSIKGVKGDSVKGQKGESGDSIKGQKGEAGADGNDGTGIKGNKGEEGNFGGATFYYTFESNTSNAQPGAGDLRLDNSTQNAATGIYIDDVDSNGSNIASFLQTIDDSTSTIKGHVKISNKLDPSQFIIFTISSLSDNTGYFDITVSPVDSSETNPFSANEDIIVTFARTGDMGEKGQKGEPSTVKGQKGEAGADGNDGSDGTGGTQGDKAGIRYRFNTSNTVQNPGTGYILYNSSTLSSVSRVVISRYPREGNTIDLKDFLTSFDNTNNDSTSIDASLVIKSNVNSDTTYTTFQITRVELASDQSHVRCHVDTSATSGSIPSSNEELVINLSKAGNKGQKGDDGADGTSVKGEKGQKGVDGDDGTSVKGQKGEPGADNSTKGQKGDTGSANTTQANAVKVNTSTENEYHNITFVPKNTTNGSFQTLEIDSTDQRLAWNPFTNTLNSYETQSYYFRTWAGSLGNSGQVLTTGGSGAGWSWTNPSDLSGYITVANQADNRLITATGTTDSLNGETNLTFDGSTLAVTGALTANYSVTNSLSGSISLGTSHIGKLLFFTGSSTITIPNNVFTDGQVIAIYNNSTSSLTLTPGSSVVLRWAGTSLTGSRTINTRALVNIICVSGTSPDEFILSGTGIT